MNWLLAVPLEVETPVELNLNLSYKGALVVNIRTTNGDFNYLIENQETEKIIVPENSIIIGIKYNSFYSQEMSIFTKSISTVVSEINELEEIPSASLDDINNGLTIINGNGYSLNRWIKFPDIFIFDFDNYFIQAQFFKRLAFFAEKPGYVGTLLTEEELYGKHGWNAHDYSSETLARFFTLARKSGFLLNESELYLEEMLISEGLIIPFDGGFIPGKGAIESISKESGATIRRVFLIHETCHGLFFTQEDFRNEIFDYWESLPEETKSAFRLFFEHNFYDPNDEYLIVNEFFAYTAQQPVDETAIYLKYKFRRVVELHPETGYQLETFVNNNPSFFEDASIKIENLLKEYFGLECGNFF